MNTEIDDAIWDAPDGSRWIYTASWEEWTGWEPGTDGHFQRTIEQFRAEYPEAPDWDENEREEH